jgi:hypothetical protein
MDLVQAKILTDLEQTVSQIQAAVINKAPVAWQITLQVTRIDCISNLIAGLLLGTGAWFALSFAISCIDKILELDKTGEDTLFQQILFVVTGVTGFAMGLFGILNLFDIWNWVGAFDPQLFIAHEAINKILNQ